MSWLWVPILILWLVAAVNGYRRGFVRIVARFFLSIILIVILSPLIESLLLNHTPMLQQITESCTEGLVSAWGNGGELGRSGEISLINDLPLMEFIKDDLIENNNSVIYGLFSANTFYEYIAGYLATMIIKIISFLLSLLLSNIIVKIVVDILDLFANLPIIGTFNRIGGVALGIGKGIFGLWVFMLFVLLLSKTQVGMYFLNQITGDPRLYYLYENNLLIQYLVVLVTM